jgi:hypothetical protein
VDWLPRASARQASCFPDWITRNHIVRENIVPQSLALTRAAICVISDIVKRRSIRVGSCKQLRDPSLSPDHFGARYRP